jgi:N-methylhydantoinase A
MPETAARPSDAVRVGVDVGGTFTDLVVARADGTLRVGKVSSTPADPAVAVLDGLAALLRQAGIPPPCVVEVVHGTTVASNTILQKTGAATGLLTTRGFRDVLEIGRIRTPDLYDLTWDKPVPLVPRRRRLEVDERLAADGSAILPLDIGSVVAATDRLVADGVTSLAICFLHSPVNPAHEQAAERAVRARHPGLDVSASWRVLPESPEYERTSTTVVNAYLLPVMRRYLTRLADGLGRIGITAPLLVVASNGGGEGGGGRRRAAGLRGGVRSRRRRGRGRPPRRGDRDREPHRLRHGRHHREGVPRGGRSPRADRGVRVP